MGCSNCDQKTCSSNSIIYEGATLDCMGIKDGDNLETILSKLEDFICTLTDNNAEVCTNCVQYCGQEISCGDIVLATEGDSLDVILANVCTAIASTASLYKEAIIDITAAEIQSLHITGKELLPYSSTVAYNIESIVLVWSNGGTVEYVYVGANTDYAMQAVIRTPIFGDEIILTSPAQEQAVATYGAGATIVAHRMRTYTVNPGQSTFDGSVVLIVDGEMTLGDSDLKAIVTYREFSL